MDSGRSAFDGLEELSNVDGLALGGKADQRNGCGRLDLHSWNLFNTARDIDLLLRVVMKTGW
jgi:hypothetical protein